jgi:hypothetical protein
MRRVLASGLLVLSAILMVAWPEAPEPSAQVDPARGARPRKGVEAQDWEFALTHYPQGVVLPADINKDILDWQAQMPHEDEYQPPNGIARRIATGPWEFIGPSGSPVRWNSQRYTGRVGDLEYRESTGLRVGSASGGLWEYQLGVPVPLTDNLSPFAGAFATHPTDDDWIVLGTGGSGFSGIGMYYTSDRGANWTKSVGISASSYHDVIFADWLTREVHASSRDGHHVSLNDGVSFTRTKSGTCTSIAVDQTTPGVLYAAFSLDGVYKTTNSGTDWDPLSIPELLPAAELNRITIALCATQPDNVWIMAATQSPGEEKPLLDVLLRSTTGGTSWTSIPMPAGFPDRQANYNQMLSVHPTDPDFVIIGGVQQWWTDDAGGTWTQALEYHWDNHRIEWNEDGSEVWNGSDGGVFHSTDRGKNYTSTANDLPITQFWTVSPCSEDPDILIGGTQDNGVPAATGLSTWEIVTGGDGGGVLIQPGDCSTSVLAIGAFDGEKAWYRRRSDDFFMSWVGIEDGIDPNRTFYPRIRSAPGQDRVFTHAKRSVYSITPTSSTWTNLTPTPFSAIVLDLGVEPGVSGGVWATLDTDVVGDRVAFYDGATWVARDGGGMGAGKVRKIVAHPYIAGTAYAILTNVGSIANKVQRTSNTGLNWTPIGDGVNGLVFTDIAIHPMNPDELWLSTTTGVQWSPNGGFSWFSWNDGLPKSLRMRDMSVVATGEVPGEYWLIAATYGRGVWRRRVSPPPVTAGPPDLANSSVRIRIASRAKANPDGSGPSLASQNATITVQVSDASFLPVAGVAASRITLHSVPDTAVVWCPVPPIADGPTDALGMTTFRSPLPVGGTWDEYQVRIDNLPIVDEMGSPERVFLAVRSRDITKDKRVDILDYVRFANDFEALNSVGSYQPRSDLDYNFTIDSLDEAWLAAAINNGASCAVAPILQTPQATIGVYFDAAGTESARVVAPGGTFPLYVIAKGVTSIPRGFEFSISGLLDPALDLGVGVIDTPRIITDPLAAPAEFRFAVSAPGGADHVLFHYPSVRLTAPVNGLALCPEPVPITSSFGSSLTPGWVPYTINNLFRIPFESVECAVINLIPGDLWAGFVVDKLGDAGINIVADELELSFLNSGLGGMSIDFTGFGMFGGAPRSLPAGVDGVSLKFRSTVPSANMADGATLDFNFIGLDNQPVVTLSSVTAGGIWTHTAAMPGLNSPTMTLQLYDGGNLILEQPGFNAPFFSPEGVPLRAAVGRFQGEVVLFQEWSQSVVLTIEGQNYNVDEMFLLSETGGSDPAGMFARADILGQGLPTILLGPSAVMRYGNFYESTGNARFRNQLSRLEAIASEWQPPVGIRIDSTVGQPVELKFPGPILADEPDAVVDILMSGGSAGELLVSLRNGAPVAMDMDLTGVGASSWSVRGFDQGLQVWEYSGTAAQVAELERWPVRTVMIPGGVRSDFDVLTQVDDPAGAANRRMLAPVSWIEIVPQQPQLGLPTGETVDMTFDEMRTVAFPMGAFGTDVPPAGRELAMRLYPAAPNPFNPRTSLQYEIARAGRVRLGVYDLRGRRVRTLFDGQRNAGVWEVVWDGQDDSGRRVASGVYHVQMVTGEGEFVRKVTLVK